MLRARQLHPLFWGVAMSPNCAGPYCDVSPIPRKHFQLPSGSLFNTTSTVPRICFASPPGESTYEAVKERHTTAEPPSRKVKSLVSGT